MTDRAEYHRDLRERQKAAGKCVTCGLPAVTDRVLCESHLHQQASRERTRRKETHRPMRRWSCPACGADIDKGFACPFCGPRELIEDEEWRGFGGMG